MATKETLTLNPLPGYPNAIGHDLARLEEAGAPPKGRCRFSQIHLDTEPEGGGNATGTLYHVAATQADRLYVDVLQVDSPRDIVARFPVDVRDSDGRPSPVPGAVLAVHLDRLSFVRGRLLERFTGMTEDDYHRPRTLSDYDVTPEWVLHHLAQHEALHGGQMPTLKTTT